MHHRTKPFTGPAIEKKTESIDENQHKPSKDGHWSAKEEDLLPFSEN